MQVKRARGGRRPGAGRKLTPLPAPPPGLSEAELGLFYRRQMEALAALWRKAMRGDTAALLWWTRRLFPRR